MPDGVKERRKGRRDEVLDRIEGVGELGQSGRTDSSVRGSGHGGPRARRRRSSDGRYMGGSSVVAASAPAGIASSQVLYALGLTAVEAGDRLQRALVDVGEAV